MLINYKIKGKQLNILGVSVIYIQEFSLVFVLFRTSPGLENTWMPGVAHWSVGHKEAPLESYMRSTESRF